MKYFLIVSIFFVLVGCMAKNPPMPSRAERPILTGEILPVDCPGTDVGILSSVPSMSKDGRLFHVFFQTMPVKPYTTVDLGIIEYDPKTQDFLQAWIDQDGDSKADYYFTRFEDLIKKFKNMCDVVR